MKNLLSGILLFVSCYLYSQPANNNCANATVIIPQPFYVSGTNLLTNQTVSGATVEGTVANGCGESTSARDVWYTFVATTAYPVIEVTNLGTSWNTGRFRMQLFLGTCGSFSEVTCTSNSDITPASALTIGSTYYIRIFRNSANANTGTTWDFDISVIGGSSRLNEVFLPTILSGANALNDPWEITYGPDNHLWVTEAKGYKVDRIDLNGNKTTVLDISNGSTFLPSPSDSLNVQFTTAQSPWPQGGLAGLALHPDFTNYPYVYISYIHRYLGTASGDGGIFYRNKLVRFTYNSTLNKLESPAVLCDTLPGSKDHNSQRMIIAPVGGTSYLFYGSGDMGSGQFENRTRVNKAQNVNSYEGKILRFNLVSDGDAGAAAWIPNDNPYSATSAVYDIGIRNNQGFAYDTALDILYGSSHGPFSDDEINIIERGKNYGHPLVIGKADGNANGTTAGAAPKMTSPNNLGSSCPTITNEVTAAAGLANYKDPLFSAYPNSTAFPSLKNLWDNTNGANASWPSEGWSGLDLYTGTYIPGWKKSLVAASLKWGRLVRLKMGAAGITTLPNNTVNDTVSYFGSINRYRDIAFAPNGKDIYVIMDKSTSTSGPSAQNPVAPACAGCLIKYTFLGYADAGGKSSIPASIDVTTGVANSCNSGTTVTIDNTNNKLWVPITGPDGNIMAEIYADGQNLGTVTSSFYQKTGAIRTKSSSRYLNRNMTITPQTQPGSPVKIRLYISKTEYDLLDADALSGISSISDLKILKNNDPCSSTSSAATTMINPTFAEAHGSNGYMLQADISGFSSFYFGNSNLILPLKLLSFTGSLQKNSTVLLKWKTENELNTSHFVVERSIDGRNYSAIGNVKAAGTTNYISDYFYTDNDAPGQQSPVLFYRLKMVDADDAYSYSNIVTITLPDVTSRVIVSPNPVTNDAKALITTSVKGRMQWSLLDNSGRVIMRNASNLEKGANTVTIHMDGLSSGVYYLNLSGAGINQNIKIQKL